MLTFFRYSNGGSNGYSNGYSNGGGYGSSGGAFGGGDKMSNLGASLKVPQWGEFLAELIVTRQTLTMNRPFHAAKV